MRTIVWYSAHLVDEKSRFRSAYDAVDRIVGPRLEALVRTGEFARTSALLARAPARMSKQVNDVTARVWHMANLPAGTDVQRLRVQIGQLDREVRRLRLQLAAQDQARAEGVSDRAGEPGERA
jgi:hypothetical protein